MSQSIKIIRNKNPLNPPFSVRIIFTCFQYSIGQRNPAFSTSANVRLSLLYRCAFHIPSRHLCTIYLQAWPSSSFLHAEQQSNPLHPFPDHQFLFVKIKRKLTERWNEVKICTPPSINLHALWSSYSPDPSQLRNTPDTALATEMLHK